MKKSIGIVTFAIALGACTNTATKQEEDLSTAQNKPTIEKKAFGSTPSGEEVFEYTLKNANGIEMGVITYGGIIRTLLVPDRDGNFEDVVLGYDNLQGYLDETPYFGAIIGRYGNRIAKGKFSLDGEEYELATNNIGNHLHGGIVGFDKVVWQGEAIEKDDEVALKMTYTSEDMEEGYPGNLEVTVTYNLNNDDELTFDYQAKSDKKTIVNLTNHAYYNLAGNKGDILDHELKINASTYLPVDETLIPTEITVVEGTPFDFQEFKKVGEDIDVEDVQLKNGGGYDHCWVLNESPDSLNFAASLVDPSSGRRMDIYTEEPGIQFYSGNFLDGKITGKDSVTYEFRTGLCLETQHFPDSPNRPEFPSTILEAGEIYATKTVTKFSIDSKN